MTSFKPKHIAIFSSVVVVLCASMLTLSASKSNAAEEKKTSAPKPALTVTTAKPAQAKLPIKLEANGNITAWEEASISSESTGLRLVELRANVGDAVHAGQVIAVFNAKPVDADVAQARAGVLEAEANAADASANATRARKLQPSGALSAQQFNQYLTTEQTAKAKLASTKATLAAQQLRLKHTKLLAPDNGVITARTAMVGAVIGNGVELFRMIRRGRLEWRAEVTSSELGRIKAGTAVTVVAASGAELKGKVRMVGPTVDLQSRSALVYVDLQAPPDGSASAKAGMFAKGEFNLGISTALTVPQQSVVVRDGFSYVFVLNSDQRVSKVKVRTGRRLGDRVELLDGIQPEATLVVNGAGFLNDGDLVKVPTAGTPSAAAANTNAAAKPAGTK